MSARERLGPIKKEGEGSSPSPSGHFRKPFSLETGNNSLTTPSLSEASASNGRRRGKGYSQENTASLAKEQSWLQ